MLMMSNVFAARVRGGRIITDEVELPEGTRLTVIIDGPEEPTEDRAAWPPGDDDEDGDDEDLAVGPSVRDDLAAFAADLDGPDAPVDERGAWELVRAARRGLW
jgi:hypothetical protein